MDTRPFSSPMSPHDEDPPDSDEEPSPPSQDDASPAPPDSSPARDEARDPVMVAFVAQYLSGVDAHVHLRNVVAGVLGKKANRALVDELASNAYTAALETKSLPRTRDDVGGWLHGIARIVAKQHFAGQKEEAKVLDRYASLDDPRLPALPLEEEMPRWFVGRWLRDKVKDDPIHRETYELIAYKARAKKTWPEVAADRDISVKSIEGRITRLKAKYGPQFEQHKRERNQYILFTLLPRLAFALVGAAIVAVIVYMFLHRNPPPTIRPDDTPPPSATASAPPPEPFMPAEPKKPEPPDKPPRPKGR